MTPEAEATTTSVAVCRFKRRSATRNYVNIKFCITTEMCSQLQREIDKRESSSMAHYFRKLLTEEFGRSLKRTRRASRGVQ